MIRILFQKSRDCILLPIAGSCLCIPVLLLNGVNMDTLLYCIFSSALLVLSVIDFRTREIPYEINLLILALGLLHLTIHLQDWHVYLIGALVVSLALYLIYLLSAGRAIGGGDVKLMAVCGLLLGGNTICMGFWFGCCIALVIQLLRMKLAHADRVFALGPYLAAGTWLAMLWKLY